MLLLCFPNKFWQHKVYIMTKISKCLQKYFTCGYDENRIAVLYYHGKLK